MKLKGATNCLRLRPWSRCHYNWNFKLFKHFETVNTFTAVTFLNSLVSENFQKSPDSSKCVKFSFRNMISNSIKNWLTFSIVERAECNKKYKNIARLPNGITERMICMLDKDPNRRSDSCQGDSGGPLLFGSPDPKSIMGVTSFGIVCGGATPGVYTSVYSYLDWIETVVWPNKKKSMETFWKLYHSM